MAEAKPKEFKFPVKLGACVDRLATLNLKIDALESQKAPLEEEFKALEEHIINSFPKDDLVGASGKLGSVERKSRPYPSIKDMKKFLAFCKRPGNEDLMLTPQASAKACRLRWGDKKVIPGVEIFDKIFLKLSLRK